MNRKRFAVVLSHPLTIVIVLTVLLVILISARASLLPSRPHSQTGGADTGEWTDQTFLDDDQPFYTGLPLGLTPETAADSDLLNPRFPANGIVGDASSHLEQISRQRQAIKLYQEEILKLKERCGFKRDPAGDLLNNRLSNRYYPVRPLIATLGGDNESLYLTTDDFSNPIINPFEPQVSFFSRPLPGADRMAGLRTDESIAQLQRNFDRAFVDRVPDVGFSPQPFKFVPGMEYPTQPPTNGFNDAFV